MNKIPCTLCEYISEGYQNSIAHHNQFHSKKAKRLSQGIDSIKTIEERLYNNKEQDA